MTGRATGARRTPRPPGGGPADLALWVAASGAAALCALTWAAGELAGWLWSGSWPAVPVGTAPVLAAGVARHLGDPRLAWPGPVRSGLPGPALLYGCWLAALAAASAAAVAGGRRLRPSGPRPGGGARWARRRDLRQVRARRPERPGGPAEARRPRGRLVLGRALGAGPGRGLLAAEQRHSVLVMGPTQSGKTSGLAVPAILEWEGPVIATSVKDDLASATRRWRSGRGPCWVFDPTLSSGLEPAARWSPLGACGDWSAAQRTAAWLVEATPARSGLADAAFWYAAAAKLLAPLLLAAERGGGSMADVARWTDVGDLEEPASLLELSGEEGAATALAACAAREERIRSSVGTTLETVLAPFEDPAVAWSTRCCEVSLRDLVGSGGTLYLCGPAHEQHRVQALFAALVAAAVDEVVRRVGASGAPLAPPLLVVLDEAANIAPVRDLDTLASTAAGMGIQLVTVCQDLAQLAARFGQERARTILNNHRAKLLLSGVCDLGTLDLLSGLAGEQLVRQETLTHDLRDGGRTRSSATALRRLAPPDELRRISPGEGVLLYGHLPPARVALRPWFRDRRLAARAGGPSAQSRRRARLGATRGGSPGIFG